jgi:negative regulator of flagellin synthesis FlgM
MSRIQDLEVTNRITKDSDRASIERSSVRGIERVRAAALSRAPTPPASSATDSVQITPSARQMLGLQQALSDVPDIDVQKVERIKLAIDRQSYKVDAARVADRLMQMDGDLNAAMASRKY